MPGVRHARGTVEVRARDQAHEDHHVANFNGEVTYVPLDVVLPHGQDRVLRLDARGRQQTHRLAP